MLGPEGTAHLVTDYLRVAAPARVAVLRDRLGVAAEDLPDPGTVSSVDRLRLGIEEWPAVLVEVVRLVRLRPVDVGDGSVEAYAGTYRVRVHLWARGHDEASTTLARDRYVLAAREALLVRRQLSDLGAPPSGIAVDPLTITEDLSPTMVDEARATILAGYLELDVTVAEHLDTAPALGTAVTVEADTRPVPHPGTL